MLPEPHLGSKQEFECFLSLISDQNRSLNAFRGAERVMAKRKKNAKRLSFLCAEGYCPKVLDVFRLDVLSHDRPE